MVDTTKMIRDKTVVKWFAFQSSFFQNEDIFVQLDELYEIDNITHAWIWFNYSLTQAQKTF